MNVMKNEFVVQTQNLCKSFKGRKVIDGINLKVRQGDIYGLLGLNGAGKTTTIKMLLGFLNPSGGEIKINNISINTKPGHVSSNIGAMIEAPAFYENLTGRKNLEIFAELYGKEAKKRVREVLEMVELTEAAEKKVNQYSMGMKQRLAIGRAFLNDPDLIILDEPTNGLDPYGMKSVRELIIKLTRDYNKTFIISTHLLHEAELLCNRVGIIHNGKLIEEMEKIDLMEMKSRGDSLEDVFLRITKEERRYA